MGGRKKSTSSLKQTYYRTFVFLVLVPLLLVFMGAMAVLSYRIRQSSLENISTFQEGLADTLKQETDENSLQMAHFVYTGRILSAAGGKCGLHQRQHPVQLQQRAGRGVSDGDGPGAGHCGRYFLYAEWRASPHEGEHSALDLGRARDNMVSTGAEKEKCGHGGGL